MLYWELVCIELVLYVIFVKFNIGFVLVNGKIGLKLSLCYN